MDETKAFAAMLDENGGSLVTAARRYHEMKEKLELLQEADVLLHDLGHELGFRDGEGWMDGTKRVVAEHEETKAQLADAESYAAAMREALDRADDALVEAGCTDNDSDEAIAAIDAASEEIQRVLTTTTAGRDLLERHVKELEEMVRVIHLWQNRAACYLRGIQNLKKRCGEAEALLDVIDEEDNYVIKQARILLGMRKADS